MLELKSIHFTIDKDGQDFDLLRNVDLKVPRGHFMAIVGPSGCGKTTLLKLIAGINEESNGTIHWEGRNLAEEGDLEPAEVGYVPQFSIAYDHLSVEESIEAAVKLRVRTRNAREVERIADQVIAQAGLDAIRDSMVKVLSGGQKRRLGLAMELVSNPTLLLCDEVTSGLDPKSEREIVHLLHQLSQSGERIVVNVTHSLSNLELYDSVLVMFEGHVVYHGPPSAMPHYFSVDHPEEVYPRLGKRSGERWHSSWEKYADSYHSAIVKAMEKRLSAAPPPPPKRAPQQDEEAGAPKTEHLTRPDLDDDDLLDDAPEDDAAERARREIEEEEEKLDAGGAASTPGLLSQFFVLLGRRWKIFLRDRTHLFLHLAILIGFPILVWIFAIDGIEPIKQFSQTQSADMITEIKEQQSVIQDQTKVGGLVSGLIMLQVILLTLMASNNSAREIAGERQIFEKEKLAGLRPAAYVGSKVAFLSALVLAQSIWMAFFVHSLCGLPGNFETQLLLLILVNAAMTAICLGISALMRSAEQASLLSIYLVGFQLPLSGAVLALPTALQFVTRPFISAYWAWSGSLSSMQDTNYYEAFQRVIETKLVPSNLCLIALVAHVAAGLIAAFVGAAKNRWEH
ncbi:MAG: ATP-binding cassette domain-containing protein [Verrucomicrobiales bacterium]